MRGNTVTAMLLEPRVAGASEIEDVPVELFEEQLDSPVHKITACRNTCTWGMTIVCDVFTG